MSRHRKYRSTNRDPLQRGARAGRTSFGKGEGRDEMSQLLTVAEAFTPEQIAGMEKALQAAIERMRRDADTWAEGDTVFLAVGSKTPERIRLPLNIGRPNMERQKVNPVKKFRVPRR